MRRSPSCWATCATTEALTRAHALQESRVFRIDFDATKIISSSQDDTIRIWNFDIDV